MWLSPSARRKCRTELALNKCQAVLMPDSRPRLEGARLEIRDKLLTPTVPSSTIHNAHIQHTHLPILSASWAGALDRYKGLSVRVQNKQDPCPQKKTNEPTNAVIGRRKTLSIKP